MKKNMLTVVILALSIINITLSTIVIFVIVPTNSKTNKLVSRVASIIDMELESRDEDSQKIDVSDIESHDIKELIVNLKRTDSQNHYALLSVTLSINKKHKDAAALTPLIAENENYITEYIMEEFSKYTMEEVNGNKDEIKNDILNKIHDFFNSDFIINLTFGNMTLQ